MTKQIRGSALLVLATVIWGAAFVAQSVGMDHIGPFTFQAVRCLLAVIALMPVILLTDRNRFDGKTFFSRWMDKKLLKAGLLCGIPLFLACNLQQVALALDADPGKSGFLTAMYIVIVPVIGIFRRQKPTIMIPISVILAVAGLYFLSCSSITGISLGDLLLLGCALMFAVQITFVDIFAQDVDPLRLNTLQALICCVLSAVVMCFTEQPSLNTIWDCRIPLLFTGVLSMGAAYALQIIGQRDVAPTAASLIMSLESVFAVLFDWLILENIMSGREKLGCLLVFVAIILSQIPLKYKKKPPVD